MRYRFLRFPKGKVRNIAISNLAITDSNHGIAIFEMMRVM